ncbi:MAG: MaoC family dehydratase N-terminal domain-containing protein [Rhodobacteraceae bacterium]|nr:MaoC family dehydratase N-terminal domain-containing protein [Paracoccaceae bacterium]
MPIDIDKLTAFAIPSARQVLTPNDIALYALSVGMGQNPLDANDLGFVDPLQGPKVMPSMVLVMAHPGFWMGDPASGIDPGGVLHATQAFEILAPLPQAGAVESRSRVAGVIDKGPGKPALVLTETDLFNDTGTQFARLDRTTFIRGGGGFGGSDTGGAPRVEMPTTPPDLTIDLPTRPEQALLYRLNGDLNPLHSDPALAHKMGFAAPILHGLCTMGVVTRAVMGRLANNDPSRLRALQLRFSNPVMPGETIRTELWNDGHFRAFVPARDALVIDGGLARISAGA